MNDSQYDSDADSQDYILDQSVTKIIMLIIIAGRHLEMDEINIRHVRNTMIHNVLSDGKMFQRIIQHGFHSHSKVEWFWRGLGTPKTCLFP